MVLASGEGDQPSVTLAGGPPIAFAAGRYSVQAVLGEGGQKVAYLVEDGALRRACALLLLKPDITDAAGLQRLEREAQAMARLHHRNIVVVHNIGEERGRPYVVCEYVPGGDLRTLLRKTGPLPLSRAFAIARDVALALQHAHQHDILHRDVKPSNIWLDDDGTAKLGDFGLAVRTDHSWTEGKGVMVGTVTYMAPEQALGEAPDKRSDLYSLGAVLYEMVTGRPPFMGDDAIAIISQHINTAPVHPSWHNPQIPQPLEDLILRLLAKAPSDRY
jgi:eukaryotic-like serine/threonine-protein kinase